MCFEIYIYKYKPCSSSPRLEGQYPKLIAVGLQMMTYESDISFREDENV